MAGNLNRVFLMGNLTRDPEVRHTSGNTAVANLGVAVNRKWKDQSGEWREDTTFVDCEAWGKTAENIAKYFAKGRPIFIEGRLKLDQWENKEGQKQSKLRVVVENFQFVDSNRDGGGGGGGASAQGGGGGARKSPAPRQDEWADNEPQNDDIPF